MVTRPATPWYYAGATAGITDTTAVTVAAAAGSNARNWMGGLQYQNTSSTASEIVVQDDSTVIWRGYAPASMTHPAVICFDPPLRGTANKAMKIAMVTTATATIVSAQGIVSA